MCQFYTLRYPDTVSKLVLVSTGAYIRDPDSAEQKAEYFYTMEWKREFFEKQVRGFFYRTPEYIDNLVEVAMKAKREAMAESTLSSAALNLLPDLGKVNIPTIIIQGEKDKARTPQDGELIRNAIRGSKLFVIKKAGHTPMIERPLSFRRILLEFITSSTHSV